MRLAVDVDCRNLNDFTDVLAPYSRTCSAVSHIPFASLCCFSALDITVFQRGAAIVYTSAEHGGSTGSARLNLHWKELRLEDDTAYVRDAPHTRLGINNASLSRYKLSAKSSPHSQAIDCPSNPHVAPAATRRRAGYRVSRLDSFNQAR
jgi:hypothetical protein